MTFNSRADHIIGGDMYYDDLGGGNYRFYITIYRDCNAEGAWFDDPLKLTIYNNNNLVQTSIYFSQGILLFHWISIIRVQQHPPMFAFKELFMRKQYFYRRLPVGIHYHIKDVVEAQCY